MHDTWSSLNFSEHVAGMLRQFCTENKNYFSRGTTYPRRQDLGVAVAAPDSVGIGVPVPPIILPLSRSYFLDPSLDSSQP